MQLSGRVLSTVEALGSIGNSAVNTQNICMSVGGCAHGSLWLCVHICVLEARGQPPPDPQVISPEGQTHTLLLRLQSRLGWRPTGSGNGPASAFPALRLPMPPCPAFVMGSGESQTGELIPPNPCRCCPQSVAFSHSECGFPGS